tara:strand:- start:31704 stop:32219 length:516 start_codon:yes stop_codon:yes gene_type:complete
MGAASHKPKFSDDTYVLVSKHVTDCIADSIRAKVHTETIPHIAGDFHLIVKGELRCIIELSSYLKMSDQIRKGAFETHISNILANCAQHPNCKFYYVIWGNSITINTMRRTPDYLESSKLVSAEIQMSALHDIHVVHKDRQLHISNYIVDMLTVLEQTSECTSGDLTKGAR